MRWQSTPCPISCSSTRLHERPSQSENVDAGALGLGFDSYQVKKQPTLRRFFGAVLPRHKAAEIGTGTRSTLRLYRGCAQD